MKYRRLFPSRSLGLVCGFILAHPGLAAEGTAARWRLDSFRAFSEGTLADGGVNMYVAADGSIRLINAFDLNQDGIPDIVLPATHGYNEKVDLSIYPNRHGYDAHRVIHLPTEGGKTAAVADLNHDGYPDLIVINSFDGTKTELNAYIYWGGPEGFSPRRRTLIPTVAAVGVAIADLDHDGWPEIIIASSGLTYHESVDRIQTSYIYWNDHGSFSSRHRTGLPTINGRDVAVADLNGDQAPDIVFAQAGNRPEEGGARIFWSHGGRYDLAHSTFLPGEGCTAVKIGDLNRDGRPDIVLANSQRLKTREAGIYDIIDTVSIDSSVYWNTPRGFDPAHRTGLPTVAASGVAIADLDGDGWPDVIFANAQGGASFVYWGSPEGFLPRRRLALPTSDASAVLAADLDRDGHVDLVFANFRKGPTFDTDSVIYWGGPRGPEADRRQVLPTSGATAVVAADLGRTGELDLIFLNKQDGTDARSPSSLYLSDRKDPKIFSPDRRISIDTDGVNSYAAADLNLDGQPDLVMPETDGVSIFWGGRPAYQRAARTVVTTKDSFAVRVADFNRDGYLDLMTSEWHPGSTETHVYYGGPGGFSPAASTALPVTSNRFPIIADFNGDGWLDVAFPLADEEKVVIFWNGPDGFKPDRRSELPSRSAASLQVADLNRDGYLDLIVPNLFNKHPAADDRARAFGGSPDGGVFIYWGSAAGYSVAHRTILPAIGAEYVAVADLRHTNRLDLVVSCYHGGTSRELPSYIYWQGPNGFDPANVTRIPTNSASGLMVADFNGDGWPDLFVANHSKDGNHRNDSYLYWGGPEGFSARRRLSLPAVGPHLLSGTDPGNVFDRRPSYSYLSPLREFPAAHRLRGIEWKAETPPGTAVRLQMRSAIGAEALARAAWEGPGGPGSFFTSPTNSADLPLHGAWVQFRALLDNPGGGLPVLHAVTLDFD